MRRKRNFHELRAVIQNLKIEDKFTKEIVKNCLIQANYMYRKRKYKRALDLLEYAYNLV